MFLRSEPNGDAGRRSSITFGCSRSARTCAGLTRCTSRSPALRRGDVPVQWTDIAVRHTGYADDEPRERKLQRDGKILRRSWPSGRTIRSCSSTWGRSLSSGRTGGGAGLLRRRLSGSAPTDSITRKLFALIARCHQMLGDLQGGAGRLLRRCLVRSSGRRAARPQGCRAKDGGPARQTESRLAAILKYEASRAVRSVDQGIYGHLTRRATSPHWPPNAATSLKPSALWKSILEECPGDAGGDSEAGG